MGSHFKQIQEVIWLIETRTGIGKVDAAIGGNVDIIGKAERGAFSLTGQYCDRPFRSDGQQPSPGIGNNQVALIIKHQTQWPAFSVQPVFNLAIGKHPHDLAILSAGVEHPLGIDGGVFRAIHLAPGHKIRQPQAFIGGKHAGQRRWRRCLPCLAVYWRGRQQETAQQQEDDQQADQQPFHHERPIRLSFFCPQAMEMNTNLSRHYPVAGNAVAGLAGFQKTPAQFCKGVGFFCMQPVPGALDDFEFRRREQLQDGVLMFVLDVG